MAAESTEFTQFYVEPKCAPPRAALLTGRHGYRSGVVDTYLGRTLLDPAAVTLAELLSEHGYATGIFGKWHLGDNYPLRPMDQGFQETLVHRGGGLGQPAGPPGNTYWDPVLEHNGESKRYEGYCTRVFTDGLIEFIRVNRDRPFFGYLATNVPHGPFDVDEEWIEPYRQTGLPERTARVYGMIEEFDQNLDRLLGELDTLGLAERTIVVFLTDNGPTQQTFTAGLKERKGSAYDGGTRVPFLFRWPEQVEAGRQVDRIAAHIDVVPTLLEAAGVGTPFQPFDGVSLWPLLSGATAPENWPDRTIYLQNHRGDIPQLNRNASARTQRWKIVQPLGKATDPMPPGAEFELYDMSVDPGETNNLAGEHPEIVEKMRRGYEEWFRDVSSRGFDPVRIHLGSPREPRTTLSRFDWRGDYDERAGEAALGYWPIVIEQQGRYDLVLRFAGPLPSDGRARVSVGEVEVAQEVAAGSASCKFPGIELEAGPARLVGVVEYDGLVRGASFIDVGLVY
ncbi:MAG: arylsulfatase [Bryobacterales bacterium]|nr:arylsulfatase [Bryobacterales bacterium]